MRFPLTAAALAAGALAAYVAWSVFGPVRYAAYGDAIRHDDFLFTVLTVQHRPHSSQYTAHIRIENQAKRVNYDWRASVAYVQDAAGARYAPAANDGFTLAPGESRVARVVFDLPAGIQKPELRFWDGVFMGDALNGNAYARTAVRLEM